MTSATTTTVRSSDSESNLSCFLYGALDARYDEVPMPQISDPHDVLVKIAYTGVCGSDVHFWVHGGVKDIVTPATRLIMGHEASGTVHSIGTSVTSLKPGDRVAIEPGFACLRCADCRGGRYNLCPDMAFAASLGPGPMTHGTLTKFFRLREECCYKLPEGVGLEEGVLVEPLAVAVRSVRLADVKVGYTCVVFGAGTVGLLVAAVCREFGAAKVVCVDLNTERLALARDLAGVETFQAEVTRSAQDSADSIIRSSNLGRGADVVIDASGVEPSVQAGFYVCKPGATYVQTGMGRPMISTPFTEMIIKELTVKGVFRYGPGDFALAIDFLERGKIDLKKLITKIVPFDHATEAWETARRGEGMKTLIKGAEE